MRLKEFKRTGNSWQYIFDDGTVITIRKCVTAGIRFIRRPGSKEPEITDCRKFENAFDIVFQMIHPVDIANYRARNIKLFPVTRKKRS